MVAMGLIVVVYDFFSWTRHVIYRQLLDTDVLSHGSFGCGQFSCDL